MDVPADEVERSDENHQENLTEDSHRTCGVHTSTANSSKELRPTTDSLTVIPRIVVSSPGISADIGTVREFNIDHIISAGEAVQCQAAAAVVETAEEGNSNNEHRNYKPEVDDQSQGSESEHSYEEITLDEVRFEYSEEEHPESRCLDGSCLYDPSNNKEAEYFSLKKVVRVPSMRPSRPRTSESPNDSRSSSSCGDGSHRGLSPSALHAEDVGRERPEGRADTFEGHVYEDGSSDDYDVADNDLSFETESDGSGQYVQYDEVGLYPDGVDTSYPNISKPEMLRKMKELIDRVRVMEEKMIFAENPDWYNLQLSMYVGKSIQQEAEMAYLNEKLQTEEKKVEIIQEKLIADTENWNQVNLENKQEIMHLRNALTDQTNLDCGAQLTKHYVYVPSKEQNLAYLANIQAQSKIAELKLLLYSQHRQVMALESNLCESNNQLKHLQKPSNALQGNDETQKEGMLGGDTVPAQPRGKSLNALSHALNCDKIDAAGLPEDLGVASNQAYSTLHEPEHALPCAEPADADDFADFGEYSLRDTRTEIKNCIDEIYKAPYEYYGLHPHMYGDPYMYNESRLESDQER